ncbi:MAG: hypothetical protein V4598_19935 [Bdellovibrionota bacterium]
MQSIVLFLLLIPAALAQMPSRMPKLEVSHETLKQELEQVLIDGNLPTELINLRFDYPEGERVSIQCRNKKFTLVIKSGDEPMSVMMKGLREMGFLFPHPMMQVTPSDARMNEACGKSFVWRPALKYRGSHLHTLHPSEWMEAFLQKKGNPEVAMKTMRWLARNQQNLVDLSLVRVPLKRLRKNIGPAFSYARTMGIYTGVSLGIALQQQKSYKLLSLWQSFSGWGAEKSIRTGLEKLTKALPLSYIVLEAGTSEFTPTNYERTLEWLNLSEKILTEKKIAVFTKVHVSSNQHSEKWGNYNFLPQHANSGVGILPHTVMFYGLTDKKAPMYGNKDFSGIRNFLIDQKDKRPTWYYPETGYWVAMDSDIPLLLTDYLKARAEDIAFLHKNNIEGNLNFTTGHALGNWLYDWNNALVIDLDYAFDPLIGIKLLDEPAGLWEEHMKFQYEWFKQKGLISMLSSANLQDELNSTHRIHDRKTMKELYDSRRALKKEIELLEEGLLRWPSVEGIKNVELKKILQVTKLRHIHALGIRKFLLREKKEDIDSAKDARRAAKDLIASLMPLPTNYPMLPIFKQHANPTSYKFGYVYPAAENFYWKREERQIVTKVFFPMKDNIISIWHILF